MTHRTTWCWIGASSTGTSHLNAGEGCDDSWACFEHEDGDRSTLVAVVSDGAGSARFAEMGSRFVVQGFIEVVVRFLRAGRSAADVTDESHANGLMQFAIGFIAGQVNFRRHRAILPRRLSVSSLAKIVLSFVTLAMVPVSSENMGWPNGMCQVGPHTANTHRRRFL